MSHAPSLTLSDRQQRVRGVLASRGLDALVISSLPNILYLTNFSGSSAIVVLTAERLWFITDFRYLTVLADAAGTPHECPGLEVVTVDGSYDASLAELLAAQPWRRIGFEASHLTVDRYRWLTSTIAANGPKDAELVATERVVERARVVKDPYEIATLREAARRLSLVASAAPIEVRRARPNGTSRSRSTGGCAKPASSAPRLIRLWRVDRTPPCRTPILGSEQYAKATWSCWTSAASTTHTAST